MKRKWLIGISILAAAGIVGGAFFWNTHIRVEEHWYPRQQTALDVRQDHLTVEGYHTLVQSLPNTQILWELPFQGSFYPLDTTELTVQSLAQTDIPLLALLPELQTVDASECHDLEALAALVQSRPELQVLYRAQVGSDVWTSDMTSVNTNADADTLLEMLPYFPNLQTIRLTGKAPSGQARDRLITAFPERQFLWTVTWKNRSLRSNAAVLKLDDITDTKQLEALMEQLPELQSIDIRGCSLPREDMFRLIDSHPGIRFSWDIAVEDRVFSNDSEEIDLSDLPMEDPALAESLVPYFPNLKKVVMCHCGIDNETMDALNRKYEDIQFVWAIPYSVRELRTDITWFVPWFMGLDKITYDRSAANLRYCTELEMIDMGHMNITNCEWAAYMPKLKYLIIADTPIADLTPLAGLPSLTYLEVFKTPVTDVSPLLECKGLRDLNIGYTNADAAVVEQLTWLDNLWWQRGWAPFDENQREIWRSLPEQLPNTRVSIAISESSTDHGWRELPNYYAQRDFCGLFYMRG